MARRYNHNPYMDGNCCEGQIEKSLSVVELQQNNLFLLIICLFIPSNKVQILETILKSSNRKLELEVKNENDSPIVGAKYISPLRTG